MPRITKISPQKKPGFFNIFIDGKFAFGLDEETLVREKLVEGLEISEARRQELTDSSLYGKLFNFALRLLSYRPRSSAEVGRYLKNKYSAMTSESLVTLSRETFIDEKMIRRVLVKLHELGYLNDEEFGRWLTEQRLNARSPRGPRLIRQELLQKGIKKEVVAGVLRNSKKIDWRGLARKLVEKKIKVYRNLPQVDQRRRLLGLLIRRGFDFELSRAVVDEVLKAN